MFFSFQIILMVATLCSIWFYKKSSLDKKKQVSILLLGASIISGLVLYFVPLPSDEIAIKAVNDKNPESNATHVVLKGYRVAGEFYSYDQPMQGNWNNYDTDFYGWVAESDIRHELPMTESITIRVPYGLERKIVFLSHDYSGTVEVCYGDAVEVIDLYSEKVGEVVTTIPETPLGTLLMIKAMRLVMWYVMTIFAVYFVLKLDAKNSDKMVAFKQNTEKQRLLVLVLILGCYVVAQYLTVRNIDYPLDLYDEIVHVLIAQDVFSNGAISSTHYPILYPIVISLAFLFENSFLAIQMVNILIATSTALISYFMLKGMVEDTWRVPISLLLLTTSFSTMAPAFQMSEVLMLPLLIGTFFYHLKFAGRDSWGYSAGAGILCLCMYYTKYLALSFLPIFGLYWISKYWDEKNAKISVKLIVKHFLIYGSAFMTLVLGYAFFYSKRNGVVFDLSLIKYLAGFTTSYSQDVAYKFSAPEYKWIVKYISYFILMSIPVIFMIINRFEDILEDKGLIKNTFNLYIGLSAVLIYTASRHSSNATYNNNEVMVRLLGRYVSYSLPIGIFLAVLLFKKAKNREKKHVIVSCLNSILIFAVSYYFMFEDQQWVISTLKLSHIRDIYAFVQHNTNYLLFVIMCLIFMCLNEIKRQHSYLFCIFLASIVLPNGLYAMQGYCQPLSNNTERTRQVYQYYSNGNFEGAVLHPNESAEIHSNFPGIIVNRAIFQQDATNISTELILSESEVEKNSYYYHSTSQTSPYSHYYVYNATQTAIRVAMIKITPEMTQNIFSGLQSTDEIHSSIEITNDYTLKGWAYLDQEDIENQIIALLITDENGEQYLVFENAKLENKDIPFEIAIPVETDEEEELILDIVENELEPEVEIRYYNIGFNVSVRYSCSLTNAKVQAVIITEDGYFVSNEVIYQETE